MAGSKAIAAIVLAGGNDRLAKLEGVTSKALLDVAGKPMVQYVLESLQQLSQVTHVCLVGPYVADLSHWVDDFVVPGQTLAESLEAGLSVVLKHKPDQILFITGDMPWLSASALEAFCQLEDADLVYAAIPEEVAKSRFPEQNRTFSRFKEGKFTGGNVLLLKTGAEDKLLPFVNRLYTARKNPLSLARMVGLNTLIALAFGQLSIAQLEKRASKILNLKARVFISKDASLGADVDKLEHLLEARKLGSSQPPN